MELPRIQWSHPAATVLMFVLLISFIIPIRSTSSNKVEKDQLVPQEPHTSIKCGECPCVNPCGQLPPPPPPPPSLPPPPKNTYCSPLQPLVLAPPPPRFVFVSGGMPGEVYQPTDDDWGFYNSKGERNVAKKLLILAGFGVLGFLTIW